MSLWIIMLIILLTGIFGGYINYMLPSNSDEKGIKIRGQLQCIILGTGAAILVPLFLELTQSKLMDNIHTGWSAQDKCCDTTRQKKDSVTLTMQKPDTAKKAVADTVPKKDTPVKPATSIPATAATVSAATRPPAKECVPLKYYLLFMGYCFVAAAAGIRFINAVTDKVGVEKQLAERNRQLAQSESEKQQAEKERDQRAAQDKKDAEAAETQQVAVGKVRTTTLLNPKDAVAAIGPVTVLNDRQKGRFGGKAENNKRKLSATVGEKPISGFYPFTLTVESTDTNDPLTGEVIFYLHDSFTPSVVTVEVTEGKAVFEKWAYGAFTTGAVCDGGKTLLELDLAEEKSFPKEFREK